eukprot:205430-Chlamydomonas_euryale.AAC.4
MARAHQTHHPGGREDARYRLDVPGTVTQESNARFLGLRVRVQEFRVFRVFNSSMAAQGRD